MILPKQFHQEVVQLAGEMGHLRDNQEVTDSPVSLTTTEQVGLVRLRWINLNILDKKLNIQPHASILFEKRRY